MSQPHTIKQTCEEAGLPVMLGLFEIMLDREEVTEEQLDELTVDQVEEFYGMAVAPAIDRISDIIRGEG